MRGHINIPTFRETFTAGTQTAAVRLNIIPEREKKNRTYGLKSVRIKINVIKLRQQRRFQPGETDFYIKGNDVVVANNGEFVTILKGGIKNARIKNARK